MPFITPLEPMFSPVLLNSVWFWGGSDGCTISDVFTGDTVMTGECDGVTMRFGGWDSVAVSLEDGESECIGLLGGLAVAV